MRRSELSLAIRDEFGELGPVLLADLALPSLGGVTGEEALHSGVRPREVWLALCEASEVPQERRYGAGRRAPRKSAG